MISWGQHFHWKDFTNTNMNGEVLAHLNNTEDVGSALSQEIIHNEFQWNATYTYVPSATSRVYGILVDGESPSLANMTAGFHISQEGVATVFFNGESITETELEEGDLLTLEKVTEELYFKKNNETFFSVAFSNSNNYRLMATLNIESSFDRIAFEHDYQPTMAAEFDTITQQGTIEVNLPSDSPDGPYHYLIGSDDYVDLDEFYQAVEDSAFDMEFNQSFFEAHNNSHYVFENLDIGEYYVSVLDNNLQTIEQRKVLIRRPLNIFSGGSSIVKEGELLLGVEENAHADLDVFLSGRKSSGVIEFGIMNPEKQQYFGFGVDTIVMSSIQDIEYGIYIEGNSAFTILEGVVDYDESVSVAGINDLSIRYDNYKFIFYRGEEPFATKQISPTLLEKMEEFEFNLNLKIGLPQVGVALEPREDLFTFTPFYTMDVEVSPLLCDQETLDVTIDFNLFSGWDYDPLVSFYTVKDENGNYIQTYPFFNPSNLNGLSPGVYTIQGAVWFKPNFNFGLYINYNINEKFIVGYPVQWRNKRNTEYDSPDEKLIAVNSSTSSGGYYASSINEINQNGVSWVDFKIDSTFNSFPQKAFGWSETLPNQFSGQGFVLLKLLGYYIFASQSGSQYLPNYKAWRDRFRMEYDGSFFKVLLNNSTLLTIPATPANIKHFNTFFAENGMHIYDVHTNMPCYKKPRIYAELTKKLNGKQYSEENGNLYFFVSEEYYDEDGQLNYKVFDKNKQVVLSNQVISINNQYGDNRNALDVSSLADESWYVLEVRNDKNEVIKLRFKTK